MPHYPTYDIPNAAVPHCRSAALTRNGKIEFPQKYLLKIVRYNKTFVIFVLETPHGVRITKNDMAKIIVQNTENLYNPNFNYGEFATIRNQSGLNR